MNDIISQTPTCVNCGAGLVIVELHIDLRRCLYLIETECLMCGQKGGIILSLDDFIELNNLEGR